MLTNLIPVFAVFAVVYVIVAIVARFLISSLVQLS